MRRRLTLALLFASITCVAQQKTVRYDLPALLEGGSMQVVNREATVVTDDGKKVVRLSAKADDGVAWLTGVDFSDGTIEVDIKGKDVLQQSFVGVAFHGGAGPDSMDVVYFRPFNFRSSDPVRRAHAVQYVSLPEYDWELLREKFTGQYEKAVSPAPKADEWFHARIVILYPDISVYVNGSATPSLQVKALGKRRNGQLGLWVGNNSDGAFANLSLTGK